MPDNIQIRRAVEADVPDITRIYNHAILNTTARSILSRSQSRIGCNGSSGAATVSASGRRIGAMLPDGG